MQKLIKNKSIGFYTIVAAALFEVAGLIWFMTWAPAHEAEDMLIPVAIIVGIALTVFTFFRDIDIIMVLIAVCYCLSVIRLLTDSIGSFVDAFQNIVMFGDATQVSTILSMAGVMGIGLLLVIIACFMKREKE